MPEWLKTHTHTKQGDIWIRNWESQFLPVFIITSDGFLWAWSMGPTSYWKKMPTLPLNVTNTWAHLQTFQQYMLAPPVLSLGTGSWWTWARPAFYTLMLSSGHPTQLVKQHHVLLPEGLSALGLRTPRSGIPPPSWLPYHSLVSSSSSSIALLAHVTRHTESYRKSHTHCCSHTLLCPEGLRPAQRHKMTSLQTQAHARASGPLPSLRLCTMPCCCPEAPP